MINPAWSIFLIGTKIGLFLQVTPLSVMAKSCPSVCRCDAARISEDATTLYLQNNQINNAGIPSDLKNLLKVQRIYLYHNSLDEFPTNLPKTITYDSLSKIPYLEELHLDDNSVSAQLSLTFLSCSHLSTIPWGLPRTIEELRLDDNRISTISSPGLQGLTSLKRLVLGGNLLTNHGLGDKVFFNLVNLTELSLRKLYLQDNHINWVPPNAFSYLRQLYLLDKSNNNLSNLPQGIFDDLDNIIQLILRNNPWYCGCKMKWVCDWLQSLPMKVNVLLFDCKDSAVVSTIQITTAIPNTIYPAQGQWPAPVTKQPDIKNPKLTKDQQTTGSPARKTIIITVKSVTSDTIHISWKLVLPMTALRLSWLKLGHSPASGSKTETITTGERNEYLVTALEPDSPYRVCMVPMETSNLHLFDDTCVCIETETKEPYKNPNLPLAAIIGGAVALVTIDLLALVCWYVHRNGSLFSRNCEYSKGRRRKDDYAEAGTKKDNSILEIRETSFQMLPISNEPISKEEFVIHTIFPPNGMNLYKNNHSESSSNQSYRDSGIPDSDHLHS
ncbi:unnamed protein product [Nyctereutes procyonoides]|uniref:(raccoon dog) hypothetical protein n=1 Tax=Nyctereutes procyonoides TaxID=34880 RepID=A0A811XZ53_NYCPR|nr:unnamed protein product [Nyctereutes procyonoides]